ncbi:hypothetical protein E308F_16820 [Moorella sp. E308F]|uniref:spermidine synthase n=1 Tax=unclassified Neomoorella TaxID=2676739 RepID=UPI0010FFB4E2|nr:MULTISPECIES: hypothetical protein [unclassified Moorella (in: firmicutes)]GEA15438.1 hypothetical protein E308F_16820 [Moorella sp. E308F]GEA19704.1 hypothetical protein E306M_28420 [Moorella sp. E306M]
MELLKRVCFALVGEKSVAEISSEVFGSLYVTDAVWAPRRHLRSSLFTVQTVLDRRDPSTPRTFPLKAAAEALAECPPSGDVLILGLGGGAFAHVALSLRPGVNVVAVDPDPAAEEAARRYFALPPHVEVVREDALAYLRQAAEGRFAFVFIDIFDRGHTPFWLGELAPLVRHAVVPGGTAAVNTTRIHPFDRKQAAAVAAFKAAFPEVKVKRFPPVPPRNEVLICWKRLKKRKG